MILLDILLAVPNPGGGTAPPGSDGLVQLLGWAKWICFGICVAALMIAGAIMAWNSRRGEGQEHGARIAWGMGGVAVISGSFALVSALAS